MSLAAITTYPRRLAHRRLAGRRARSRYEELRKAWLRQSRARLVGVAVVFAAIGVAGSAFDRAWYGRFGVLTGLVWGTVITAWVALRNSPPGFIAYWQQGAWGEQFTADELAQLPRHDWEIVHDLADHGRNIDHIVAGPSGIFLLDSQNYDGTVRVEGDDLVVTREIDTKHGYRDHGRLGVVRGQAAALNRELRNRTGRSAWINPVVVIWATFPERIHEGNGVTVIHGRELAAWLKDQPPRRTDATWLIEHLRYGRHRQQPRPRRG